MRLLPILWAEPPTAEDWARLSEARTALGYKDLIKPVPALEGSPQPILAVHTLPTWMTDFGYIQDINDGELVRSALAHCLWPGYEQTEAAPAQLLSEWMGVEVKMIGEEEYDSGVRFS